jgi:two-component system response regulator YesN
MNVLIVDDEAPVKRSLTHIIERELPHFHVVCIADNGLEALKHIEELRPDLIITDVKMPELDGLQLSREIRKRGYSMEIIVVSGYNDYSYLREALQHGVMDYLLKPVDPDEVVATLGRVYERHQNRQKELMGKQVWLSDHKVHIQKLAESIWFLQEEQVWEQVKELGVATRSSADTGASQTVELCMQWMTMVNAELKQLSGGKLSMEEHSEFRELSTSTHPMQEVKQLINTLMDEIRRMRNWGSHRIVLNALDYIQLNFSKESLSLGEIADAVGMSATYFSKCFRAEMGVSCTQHITRLRMKKAMELLSDPSFKVYEVAHATGFNEYAHFAKVFKKTFDFSPSEYRTNLGIS